MLVVPGGIVNPWLRKADVLGGPQSWEFAWAEPSLRPNTLRTCQAILDIGMPILYGCNTFQMVDAYLLDLVARERFILAWKTKNGVLPSGIGSLRGTCYFLHAQTGNWWFEAR